MKPAITFTCTHCDAQYTKWVGRCLECGQWGTVKETSETSENPKTLRNTEMRSLDAVPLTMRTLNEINSAATPRIPSGIGELDRVLGGGIVPGSLILLGGEPGIGKSTLALQLATRVPNTLYISGEESVEQIKLRADRLQIQIKDSSPIRGGQPARLDPSEWTFVRADDVSRSGGGGVSQCPVRNEQELLRLANASNVESILSTITKEKPPLAIIDSIQTISSEEIAGEPGSVSQVRACTAKILDVAKAANVAILLVGHITKDGSVAGPKTLEHLVDTVLIFEGDPRHEIRILRGTKNRFGGTDEVGMFEMVSSGLREVKNPSGLLLAERGDNTSGSILTCIMEGTRPLLVEIQALVTKTSFGYPVRKASGFDLNRLHVLLAVLQQRAGLGALAQYDVHLNIVGGVTADEPAADLAVALAVASAYKDKQLGNDLVCFGEVGLGGEIRSVRALDRRIRECEMLGMKRVIVPHSHHPASLSASAPLPFDYRSGQALGQEGKQTRQPLNIKIIEVKNIQELITHT